MSLVHHGNSALFESSNAREKLEQIQCWSVEVAGNWKLTCSRLLLCPHNPEWCLAAYSPRSSHWRPLGHTDQVPWLTPCEALPSPDARPRSGEWVAGGGMGWGGDVEHDRYGGSFAGLASASSGRKKEQPLPPIRRLGLLTC